MVTPGHVCQREHMSGRLSPRQRCFVYPNKWRQVTSMRLNVQWQLGFQWYYWMRENVWCFELKMTLSCWFPRCPMLEHKPHCSRQRYTHSDYIVVIICYVNVGPTGTLDEQVEVLRWRMLLKCGPSWDRSDLLCTPPQPAIELSGFRQTSVTLYAQRGGFTRLTCKQG